MGAKVLIVAEHLDDKLNAATARCVSAAQALSPEAIDVVVLAADPSAVAAEAAQVAGVSKVLAVANPANANAIAQVLAPQVAKLAAGYTHVFGPSTTFGKDLMPCIAALLGVAQVSDVMSVEGERSFRRNPSCPRGPRRSHQAGTSTPKPLSSSSQAASRRKS